MMPDAAYRFADPRDDLEPTRETPDVLGLIAEMEKRSAESTVEAAAYRLGIWAFDIGRLVNAYVAGTLKARAWLQGFQAARETEVERRLARAFLVEAEARAVTDAMNARRAA